MVAVVAMAIVVPVMAMVALELVVRNIVVAVVVAPLVLVVSVVSVVVLVVHGVAMVAMHRHWRRVVGHGRRCVVHGGRVGRRVVSRWRGPMRVRCMVAGWWWVRIGACSQSVQQWRPPVRHVHHIITWVQICHMAPPVCKCSQTSCCVL